MPTIHASPSRRAVTTPHLSRPRDRWGRFLSPTHPVTLPPKVLPTQSVRAEVPAAGPLSAPLAFRVNWGADSPVTLLRYPGGKQRLYWAFAALMPTPEAVLGRLIEPFVGSGAVFFLHNPRAALLADLNPELIDLYQAVRDAPNEVWKQYAGFPVGREGYYAVRRQRLPAGELVARAARTLYLSRTCFKGQWRMNSRGEFNVGYGGLDRHSVVTLDGILEASARLQRAELRTADFEETIATAERGDLLYADPPYRPGARELLHQHYLGNQFSFADHRRLAWALRSASRRGIPWLLSTTGHPDITGLFEGCRIYPLQRGRHAQVGHEVVITSGLTGE